MPASTVEARKHRHGRCHTTACEARVAHRAELHRTGCTTRACYRRIAKRIARKHCLTGATFVATSYGPPWGGIEGGGITALGVDLRAGPAIHGIAADPGVLRLGSRVKVWPNPFGHTGRFRVFDTGGAIRGNRLDFYDWRGRAAQNGWGRRTVRVCRA